MQYLHTLYGATIMLKNTLLVTIKFLTFSFIYIINGAALANPENMCPGGASPNPLVIWCDSFEDDNVPPGGNISDNYFEFDDNNGDHVRINTESIHGQSSLRARWQPGETDAGHLVRNFGRNPLGTQSHDGTDFKEIYWRMYVKHPAGAVGRPYKLSRATSFATTNRAQSMIAHVWRSNTKERIYAIDPATGINSSSQLATTKWNDFTNLKWLGLRESNTPIDNNQWYCIEARVKLNSTGQSDGIFQLWIDDNLEASHTDLNWVGDWQDFGINSLFISHWWNGGSTSSIVEERYIDALIISQSRIGCLNSPPITPPKPPSNVTAN